MSSTRTAFSSVHPTPQAPESIEGFSRPEKREFPPNRLDGARTAVACVGEHYSACGARLIARRRLSVGLRAQLRESPMDNNLVDGGHLKAFIERIEKLEEEKRAIADDIKDVYGEAKATGFDPKIIRKIVSLRKQDKSKREEEEEILSLYLAALGME
jgi:uncharacterized protein (UPF0335 family)